MEHDPRLNEPQCMAALQRLTSPTPVNVKRVEVECSEWVEVWKRRYPSLKALGGGWHLAAHPNGPAIMSSEEGFMGSLAYRRDN